MTASATTPTAATSTPAIERPSDTQQRLDKEMTELRSPVAETSGVTRKVDAKRNQVDTWQTGPSGQSHTTESYRRNANGTISKRYEKQYPDGTIEQSTLDVGENGSCKTTTYTRDGRTTTVTIQTLPDGSRVVEKQSDEGKSITTRYTPEGKRVPDGPPQPAPTGASPTPPANGPAADKTAPEAGGKSDIPPPTQPSPEQLENDRVAFYEFFKAHPTNGDQNDYEKSMRELAAQGNTYARQKLGEHDAKEARYSDSVKRDAEAQKDIAKNCTVATATWAVVAAATVAPVALALVL